MTRLLCIVMPGGVYHLDLPPKNWSNLGSYCIIPGDQKQGGSHGNQEAQDRTNRFDFKAV